MKTHEFSYTFLLFFLCLPKLTLVSILLYSHSKLMYVNLHIFKMTIKDSTTLLFFTCSCNTFDCYDYGTYTHLKCTSIAGLQIKGKGTFTVLANGGLTRLNLLFKKHYLQGAFPLNHHKEQFIYYTVYYLQWKKGFDFKIGAIHRSLFPMQFH